MQLKNGIWLAVIIAILEVPYAALGQQPNPYEDASKEATMILNQSLGSIGTPRISPDNPVARFIALVQRNEALLEPTHQQVCDAWKAMPPDQPFTGDFSAGGLTFSLDKLCGIKR